LLYKVLGEIIFKIFFIVLIMNVLYIDKK